MNDILRSYLSETSSDRPTDDKKKKEKDQNDPYSTKHVEKTGTRAYASSDWEMHTEGGPGSGRRPKKQGAQQQSQRPTIASTPAEDPFTNVGDTEVDFGGGFVDDDEEEAKERLAALKSLETQAKVTPKPSSGQIGDISVTQTAQKSKGSLSPEREYDDGVVKSYPPSKMKGEIERPRYPGKFVGQVAVRQGPYNWRFMSYTDKKQTPPEKKSFMQPSKSKITWVWDGERWVNPDTFDLKMSGKLESFERIFEERCRTTK